MFLKINKKGKQIIKIYFIIDAILKLNKMELLEYKSLIKHLKERLWKKSRNWLIDSTYFSMLYGKGKFIK
jgi:hypothetical protein